MVHWVFFLVCIRGGNLSYLILWVLTAESLFFLRMGELSSHANLAGKLYGVHRKNCQKTSTFKKVSTPEYKVLLPELYT